MRSTNFKIMPRMCSHWSSWQGWKDPLIQAGGWSLRLDFVTFFVSHSFPFSIGISVEFFPPTVEKRCSPPTKYIQIGWGGGLLGARGAWCFGKEGEERVGLVRFLREGSSSFHLGTIPHDYAFAIFSSLLTNTGDRVAERKNFQLWLVFFNMDCDKYCC